MTTSVITISSDNPVDEVVIGGKGASETVVGISELKVDKGSETVVDMSELVLNKGSETVVDMSELKVDERVVRPIM